MKYHQCFLILLLQNSLTTIPVQLVHAGNNNNAGAGAEDEDDSSGSSSSSIMLDFVEDGEIQSPTNGKEETLNQYWSEMIKTTRHSTIPISLGDNSTNSVLMESASKLSFFLQQFTDLELGVRETKASYESVSFDMKRQRSPTEHVQELANRINEEMTVYQDALERMVESVKLSYQNKRQPSVNMLPICCELKSQSLQYNTDYKNVISLSSACSSTPQSSKRAKKSVFVPNKEFGNVLISNAERLPNLKWQYFVSPEGVQIQYPANRHNCPNSGYENKTTSIIKTPSSTKQKSSDSHIHRIIFLIQLDSFATETMIKSIKNIVFQLLKLLDEPDEVGIINSEPDQLWSNFVCDQMLRTNSWTRFQIINYLNYLESRYKSTSSDNAASPDHFLGLQKAIEMACSNSSSSDSADSNSSPLFPPIATTIIQLSSSGLDISKFKSRLLSVNCPIFIESFFLQPFNSTLEESYRKAMADVAITKNILRVQVFSTRQNDPDSFADKVTLQLRSKKEWWSLSDILSQFFPQENNLTVSHEFSLPHWNNLMKESVIIGKRYVFSEGRPLGLVSLEVPLLAVTQHLISFSTNDHICDAKNYAFLIDKNGKVVVHPAFGRLDGIHLGSTSIPIEQVEVYTGFPPMKRRILSEATGCGSIFSMSDQSWITYAWATTLNNYIIVVALYGKNSGCDTIAGYSFTLKRNALSTNDIQHHLLLDKTLCCNQQLISINKAALYLGATAFHRPADSLHLEKDPNKKGLLSLMAFIGDQSGMIQNPKRSLLKSATKYHIGVLGPTVQIWKQRYFQSDWNKYILRRFISAAAGSFLVIYPGLQVSSGYSPKSTTWFRNALIAEGKLVFQPPTFDPEIKLPIVTMSQAIQLKIKSGPFSPVIQETTVSVVGTDLHAGFLQKLVEDLLPDCRNDANSSLRCFLFDENGLVIYHPRQIGSYHLSADSLHLSQVEPLAFIDILQQTSVSGYRNKERQPLLKFMCNKVSNTQGGIRRMYKFSLDMNGIQKLKHGGELCNLYFIVPVPNTNLFLGVVRDNCSPSTTAFCPCSRVDDLCLNCLRMEPTDCECPCECPREPGFCLKKTFIDLPEDIVPCEFPAEELSMARSNLKARTECDDKLLMSTKNLDKGHLSCDYLRPSGCSSFTRSSVCLGSWDCEWCLVNNVSGSKPTCTKYSDCYGITNETSLKLNHKRTNNLFVHSNEDFTSVASNDEYQLNNDSQITLVPILAVFSVFLIFIGLVIYCYRRRVLTLSDSQPNLLLPLQETPVGLLSPGADNLPASDENSDDSDNQMLPVQLPIVVVNRRRHAGVAAVQPPRSPVASSVSDLGYSTMTGENSSECAGPAVVPISPPPPLSKSRRQKHEQLSSAIENTGILIQGDESRRVTLCPN